MLMTDTIHVDTMSLVYKPMGVFLLGSRFSPEFTNSTYFQKNKKYCPNICTTTAQMQWRHQGGMGAFAQNECLAPY